ncbi:hypothetical protein [Pseudomonas putida]
MRQRTRHGAVASVETLEGEILAITPLADGTAFQAGKRHGVLMRLDRQGDLDPGFASGQGYSVAPELSEYFGLVIEGDGTLLTAGYLADPEDKAWLKRHGVDGEGAVAAAHDSPAPLIAAGRRSA